MSKMSVFVAEGLEEVECLSAVDIARRGGVDVTMVSVTGDLLLSPRRSARRHESGCPSRTSGTSQRFPLERKSHRGHMCSTKLLR